MSVSGTQNASCCSLPPVEANYTPKGSYTDITGLKSYTVGPEDAKAAILIVYDIFGFSPQALQGADLLASQGFRVVMPDLMKGQYATRSMFDGSDEGNAAKAKFFGGFPGAIESQVKPTGEITAALAEKYSLGALGFCWGYKVIVMSSEIGKIKAIATGHPSFPAVEDAERIHVPFCSLPSQGEDMSIVKPIHEAVHKKHGKNVHKHFHDQPHGFLAARADLSDPKAAAAFHEGYTIFADFFKENL